MNCDHNSVEGCSDINTLREGLVLKWVKSLFRVSPIGARVWFVSCNNGLGHASKNLARLSKWYMSLIRLSTVAFVLLRVGANILGWYSVSPALRKLRWLRFYLGPRKVMIQSARPPSHLFQWVTSHSLWRGFNNWFTDWCSVLPAKHATIICCFVQLEPTLHLNLLSCLLGTMQNVWAIFQQGIFWILFTSWYLLLFIGKGEVYTGF